MSLALRLRTPLAGGISTSSTVFSGHNRWSKISKGKGVQDAKKSQLYSRHMTDIIGAARRGGSTDPANNLALSIALRKAKMADVPKDKIEAALTRASSTSTEDALHSSVFEAIGPGSVPMIIECLSNNVNRTSKAVKEILNDRGGRLAPVAYLFDRKGSIILKPREGATFEHVFELAVDAGAESVEEALSESGTSDGEIEILTEPSQLSKIASSLSSEPHSHVIQSMEFVYIPTDAAVESSSLAQDSDDFARASTLIQHLRDEPDCVNVWTAGTL